MGFKNKMYSLHHYLYRLNRHYILHILFAGLLATVSGYFLSHIKIKSDGKVTVTIEFEAQLNDVFHLFYLPAKEMQYSDENSVHKEVRGKENYQTLLFDLPDSLHIKNFRFDLGNDSLQKQVRLKKIVLTYNNEHLILFDPDETINYFQANEFVTYKGGADFILHPPVNKQYDPFIFSRDISRQYSDLLKSERQIPFPFLITFIVIFSLLINNMLYLKTRSAMDTFYTIASCLFVIILLLPSVDETFALSEENNLEKRALSVKPSLSAGNILEYPKQFEAYYNDNFGFRNMFVALGGKIKYHFFRSSSIPSKCAVGKNGWLFLDGEFYRITQDLTRENLYKQKDLESSVQEWETRKRDLERDSIKYYKAFWPDKQYIYPEFMPFNMRVIMKDTIARCDQVLNYLKEKKSPVHIIDVRQALLSEKKRVQVYEKYDSHWNSYGAFIAYTCLLNDISKDFPQLKPNPISKFEITWNNERGGDMMELLNIDLCELKPTFRLKRNIPGVKEIPADGFPEKTIIFINDSASSSLTALIYRDSFTTALIPFLKLHFKKMVLLSNIPFSKEMVNKVNPDIVIEGYASRYFR